MCGSQPGENGSLREGRGPGMPGPYRVAMKKGEDDLQSYLEQAFGKSDVTSVKMRAAVREWFDLYYGVPRAGEDSAPRVAALIVGKLCRTVFAEYETRLPPEAPDPLRRSLSALNAAAKTAMQRPSGATATCRWPATPTAAFWPSARWSGTASMGGSTPFWSAAPRARTA